MAGRTAVVSNDELIEAFDLMLQKKDELNQFYYGKKRMSKEDIYKKIETELGITGLYTQINNLTQKRKDIPNGEFLR
jgi:hypothetical protein